MDFPLHDVSHAVLFLLAADIYKGQSHGLRHKGSLGYGSGRNAGDNLHLRKFCLDCLY